MHYNIYETRHYNIYEMMKYNNIDMPIELKPME